MLHQAFSEEDRKFELDDALGVASKVEQVEDSFVADSSLIGDQVFCAIFPLLFIFSLSHLTSLLFTSSPSPIFFFLYNQTPTLYVTNASGYH